MDKMLKIFIIFVVLLFQYALSAEVYTLGTGGGAGSGNFFESLNPHKLWNEPVIINGVSTGITISLLDSDLKSSMEWIKKLFPDARLSSNPGAALIELKKNGVRKRIYLVQLNGVFPVVQFSMEIPDNIPNVFLWPKELPLPSDADPINCIRLPDRNAVYGHFVSSWSPEQMSSDINAKLMADGWHRVSGEDSEEYAQKEGDVFMKESPLKIMVISFSENTNGENKGSIYLQNLPNH